MNGLSKLGGGVFLLTMAAMAALDGVLLVALVAGGIAVGTKCIMHAALNKPCDNLCSDTEQNLRQQYKQTTDKAARAAIAENMVEVRRTQELTHWGNDNVSKMIGWAAFDVPVIGIAAVAASVLHSKHKHTATTKG